MQNNLGTRFPRDVPAAPLAALALTVCACQTYRPRPLDSRRAPRELGDAVAGIAPRSATSRAALARVAAGARWQLRPAERPLARRGRSHGARLQRRPPDRAAPRGRGLRRREVGRTLGGPGLRIRRRADPERRQQSLDRWRFARRDAAASPAGSTPRSARPARRSARRSRASSADEWALRMRVRAAWLDWSFQGLRDETTRRLLERLDGIVAIATGWRRPASSRGSRRASSGRSRRRGRSSSGRENRARASSSSRSRSCSGSCLTLRSGSLPATELGPRPAVDVLHNPSLAALSAAYDVAEEALRLEIRKQYPDLTIAPGLQGRGRRPARHARARAPAGRSGTATARGSPKRRRKRETARAEFETGYETLVARVRRRRARARDRDGPADRARVGAGPDRRGAVARRAAGRRARSGQHARDARHARAPARRERSS